MDSEAFKHKLGVVISCIIINTAGSFAATSLNLLRHGEIYGEKDCNGDGCIKRHRKSCRI